MTRADGERRSRWSFVSYVATTACEANQYCRATHSEIEPLAPLANTCITVMPYHSEPTAPNDERAGMAFDFVHTG